MPELKLCPCCDLDKPASRWWHLFGCCDDCALCRSLGLCYVGEDVPENTTCCHGNCREIDDDDDDEHLAPR